MYAASALLKVLQSVALPTIAARGQNLVMNAEQNLFMNGMPTAAGRRRHRPRSALRRAVSRKVIGARHRFVNSEQIMFMNSGPNSLYTSNMLAPGSESPDASKSQGDSASSSMPRRQHIALCDVTCSVAAPMTAQVRDFWMINFAF